MFNKAKKFIKYKIINQVHKKVAEHNSIKIIKKHGFVKCTKDEAFNGLNDYYVTYQHLVKKILVLAIVNKDAATQYPDCCYQRWSGLILKINKPVYFIKNNK